MSMDRGRHEPFEELISASLHGDLTDEERRSLDAHLDGCERCRETLAAFSDQRRIVAGLRHLAPPRDLQARVRAGIEAGAVTRPWWRRPPAIFAGVGGGLAVVAGALLALVVLNGTPDQSPVGQPTATPASAAPVASATPPPPTLAPVETPAASATPAPSVEPAPTATPVEWSPEPDAYLAVTGPFDNQLLTVRHGPTGEGITEADAPSGPPIAAELSPDGQWVAYLSERGLSGFTEVRAVRIAESTDVDRIRSNVAVGETRVLGQGLAGSPFVEHLSWSPDSRYLAFTLIDIEGGGTDVWIFQSASGSTTQLTDVGNAYAGSWTEGGTGSSLLWVSTAGETPQSHLLMFHDEMGRIEAGDPADSPFASASNVFQPLVSPNGALVVYWTGRMDRSGEEWAFSEGGSPWLAMNVDDGGDGFEFESSRRVFTDLTIDRDAFTSAAISWGLDSDAFAIWDAEWTGISQGAEEEYPDPRRVYLGRATDPRHVTRIHALDVGDVPDEATVVDVKLAGTGRHLAITARYPVPGDLSTAEADLLLVTRNTGDVPDEVSVLNQTGPGWYGPALYALEPAGD
ncbi:MAG TPA: zf-HC2 domain-containing protein [Patescibacteria group bacterium]|nr:zf-HC2 domain-containing protein [Patescibacteria group bacterium]